MACGAHTDARRTPDFRHTDAPPYIERLINMTKTTRVFRVLLRSVRLSVHLELDALLFAEVIDEVVGNGELGGAGMEAYAATA